MHPGGAYNLSARAARRRKARRAVGVLLTVAMAMSAAACRPDPASGLPTWPKKANWQDLVPGPDSDDVQPVAITRTHGGVSNADALLGKGGETVLTVEPGGPPAVVVLDYGQEVGGTPYVDVAGSTATSPATSNTLRISTSEALRFLNTNATTALTGPAKAGDTNVRVASNAPFYTGTSITIGTGEGAETRNVTAVGSGAATNTSLVLPAGAGDRNVSVASVNGYAVGAPLTVDTGAGAETVTISGVGTAAGAPTTIVYPAAAGATIVKTASTAGFATGERVVLGSGATTAVRTVTGVGTAATTTRLFGPVAAGATSATLTSVAGLTAGAEVDIDPGPGQEHVTIASVGTAGMNSTVAAANATSGTAVPALTGANWIWNVAGAGTATPAGTIYLRKTFEVTDPASLASAVLRVNADDSHVTYVNGTQVSTSTGANNAWQTSQITDIKSLLVAGTNVIATAATNAGSGGGVLAAAQLDSTRIVSDGSWKALPGIPAAPPAGWNTASFDDASWAAANVAGAYGIAPWNTNIAEPASPTTLRVASVAGFTAGDTIAVGTGAGRETRTIASVGTAGATGSGLTLSTPLSIVHSSGDPVLNLSQPGTGITFTPAVTAAHDALANVASPGTGVTFTPALDADVAAGTAIRGAGSGITFTPALTAAHAGGATVGSAGSGITFSTALSADHPSGTTAAGLGTYANDNGAQINLTVTDPQTYTGGLRGGYRFEAIELRTPGTVRLSRAGLNFKAYRAGPDKYEGWFLSSDDQLNKMWYAGAYTAQMDMVPVGVASCFTVPVFFDGAKRDRAIWSGDLMVTDPVAMMSIGSNSHPYVRGSIDSILNLQAPTGRLTSAVGFRGCGAFDYAVTYSAYSAIIAVQYYRYSGDEAYTKGILPKLEAATAFHATRLDANGLVVTNDNDYWQTRQNGEVTEYSLAYYELLQDMIWLESHVGTPEKVAEYTDKAAALKTAINARLFNADAGLYQHTDTRPGVFPLDANMNAVRLGVAPQDQVEHILSYFKERWQPHGSEISQPAPSMTDPYGHTIEPLNNTWEMMARIRSGDAAGALELLRRLWGLQVDPDSGFYTGTFWEFVMSDGLPDRGFDSLAHAWGAGPTQILTEAVLGATSVDPGYATWTVKPQPTDLKWAQGTVPTAHGGLTVKWAQDTKDGEFHMQVVSPSGTAGEVWVPLASATGSASAALTEGATFLRREGGYDVYRVGSGTFEFGSAPVTFDAVKELVADFSTDRKVTRSLTDNLESAQRAHTPQARGKALDGFVALVDAQQGRALTTENAAVLRTLANALR
ncbi:alpha-L-rhamnosidase [Asanoa hainanensis]|uniref:Alpha-L-rhamnosidase n=1 Tax=Asanoa hainanensis TaxID=560556 RepID=A0A239PEN2_9ACTN|nr:alpha-L-rhamnosidase C-terminal domain-containing protein [Asanoa hainanensis]SNT65472.1 alpha-L-rhamnosidase [Asanoa hainanensis]